MIAVKRMWAAPWRPWAVLVLLCWLIALTTCLAP